jgi:ADP-heptose:LPS heptosyltransferase
MLLRGRVSVRDGTMETTLSEPASLLADTNPAGPRDAGGPSKLGRLIGWYIRRFRLPEPLSFAEAFANIQRVLVVPERGVIGALFAMPTIRAMRRGFPDSKIAVLVEEDDRDLLDGLPELDKVIGYRLPAGVKRFSALLALSRRLKSHRFDVSILLDREFSLERAFVCYMSGALVRAGLQSDQSYPLFNLELSNRVPGRTRAQLGLEVARVMGVDVDGLGLDWAVPERERRLAEQLVHFRKPREDELLVGFDPGPGRRGTSVSLAQQARLLDRLCSDYRARAILLTAPDHHGQAKRLEGMLSRDPIVVQQRRMRDVVSLLGQCDLFVAGNTDLVYFAVAMGIPTVVLMTAHEFEESAFPESSRLEMIRLTPGERFPIEEFIERTEAVLLAGTGPRP